MTWSDLKKLLDNMAELKHSALDDEVSCFVQGSCYGMHLHENLVDGSLNLIPIFVSTEEEDE